MSLKSYLQKLFEKPKPTPVLEPTAAIPDSVEETHSDIVRRWFADKGDATLRLDYDLNADSIVLDFGGYEGDWAAKIHDRYGCTVHVFEPVAAFAESCEKRFIGNDKVIVHPFGLGASTRDEMIGLSDDGSSMFETSKDSEPIRIIDLTEWLVSNPVDRIHLAKLNIEGGEYELLERFLDLNLAEKVDDFQVQFHRVAEDSEQRLKTIQQRLTNTHKLSYHYHFVWENWHCKGA